MVTSTSTSTSSGERPERAGAPLAAATDKGGGSVASAAAAPGAGSLRCDDSPLPGTAPSEAAAARLGDAPDAAAAVDRKGEANLAVVLLILPLLPPVVWTGPRPQPAPRSKIVPSEARGLAFGWRRRYPCDDDDAATPSRFRLRLAPAAAAAELCSLTDDSSSEEEEEDEAGGGGGTTTPGRRAKHESNLGSSMHQLACVVKSQHF
jgi:hypothetical protein